MSQPSLKRLMTLRYTLGLTLIAAVIIGAYVVQSQQLEAKKQDAHIINISGMQRMLSQRIALMAREVELTANDADRQLYWDKMDGLVTRMQDNHTKLLAHLESLPPSHYTDKLYYLYHKEQGIAPRVNAYLTYTNDFLAMRDKSNNQAISEAAVNITAIARNGLLRQLNNAVLLYEERTTHMLEQFRNLELAIMWAGLCLLVMEACFIFAPMVRMVSRKTEELQQSNAELTEFSYRISHDLRAPIVSSRGLVDVVTMMTKVGNSEKANTALQHIKTSLIKLETLIEDIVNMTRMKREQVEKEDVNLDALIKDSLEGLEHMEECQHITISHEIIGNPLMHVKRIYLTQVLDNLISNSIKYYDNSKAQPYINISATIHYNECVLRVKDNGVGIPPEYHDQLFGMFKRFHPKQSFGSGLGLYLTAQNARALGGHITYDAHKDGSIFTLTFPTH